MHKRLSVTIKCLCLFSFSMFLACGKSDDDGPSDPCAGTNISVSLSKTASEACTATGTITVTATGSSGFTYKLNSNGTYQAENVFNNVAPGDYTVFAKDSKGCESSSTVTVNGEANGPTFTAVKSLINAKCISCHNGSNPAGVDFRTDCAIEQRGAAIKTQAVDQETMPQGGPPLTATEKKVITDWLTAGGKTSD